MAQAVMMFVAAMDLDGSIPPTYSHQTDEGTATWADSEALRELSRKQAIFPDVERIVERCGGERVAGVEGFWTATSNYDAKGNLLELQFH